MTMTHANNELIPGRGVLITFEGGDGSGKGTQTGLLFEYLENLGFPVRKGGYPMYHTPTGEKVADYLNGRMDENVPADIAGKLYSDDRLANKDPIEEWVNAGGIQLLDRYVESNSGHQGGKMPTKEERIQYILHNARLEYATNGLMRPDLTLLFTLAPELAQAYVAKKMASSRTYTDKSHDIHEADPEHLRNANEAFLLLTELYPERVRHIDITAENGLEMRSREDIQSEIIRVVRPLLEAKGFSFPDQA